MKSLSQPSTATSQQYDSGRVSYSLCLGQSSWHNEGGNAYGLESLEEGKLHDTIHGASHIVIVVATR